MKTVVLCWSSVGKHGGKAYDGSILDIPEVEAAIQKHFDQGLILHDFKLAGDGNWVTFVGFFKNPREKEPDLELEKEQLLDRRLREFEWGKRHRIRVLTALGNRGIETLRQLLEKSESDLLKTRNFGKLCLEVVKQQLSELGLSFCK